MKDEFIIDFHEFCFLVEACIPPRPIARSYFWLSVIDRYYHQLSVEQRNHLYDWIKRNPTYQHSMESGNSDCILFDNRFNPDNQYKVTTSYDGNVMVHYCFKQNESYYTSSNTWILDLYITNVEKLTKKDG